MTDKYIEEYSDRIKKVLSFVHSNGYKEGLRDGKKEMDNLRTKCHRESGNTLELDNNYADNWNDYTRFYGWCSNCKRPHSGRWAHVWEYCPWCGGKIDHSIDDPYPTGLVNNSKLYEEIFNMCEDINFNEIKAHDTDDSLNTFCNAWNRNMKRLICNAQQSKED